VLLLLQLLLAATHGSDSDAVGLCGSPMMAVVEVQLVAIPFWSSEQEARRMGMLVMWMHLHLHGVSFSRLTVAEGQCILARL